MTNKIKIKELGDGNKIEYHYDDFGNRIYIRYYLNDKIHKEDGPATNYYNSDGSYKGGRYWLNGELYTKKEWSVKTRKLKLNKIISKI